MGGNSKQSVNNNQSRQTNTNNNQQRQTPNNHHIKPIKKDKPKFFDINGKSVLLKDVVGYDFEIVKKYYVRNNKKSGITSIFFNLILEGRNGKQDSYYLARHNVAEMDNLRVYGEYDHGGGHWPQTKYPDSINITSTEEYEKAQRVFKKLKSLIE